MILSILPHLLLLNSKEVQSYNLSNKDKKKLLSITLLLSPLLYYFLQISVVVLSIFNILVVCTFIDNRHREIPDSATYISLFIYVFSIIISPPEIVLFNTGIAALIYIILLLGCVLGYIGGGDIKILLPIFLILGENILYLYIFLLLTSLSSIILALPEVLKKRTFKITTPMSMPFTIAFIFTELVFKII